MALSPQDRTAFVNAYTRILINAWSSEEFAGRLDSDPKAVLRESGLDIPAEAEVVLVRQFPEGQPEGDLDVADRAVGARPREQGLRVPHPGDPAGGHGRADRGRPRQHRRRPHHLRVLLPLLLLLTSVTVARPGVAGTVDDGAGQSRLPGAGRLLMRTPLPVALLTRASRITYQIRRRRLFTYESDCFSCGLWSR